MEVSEDAKRILENLPPDGSMIGNMSLRDSLELDPKKYFDAKRELEVAGLIVTGKGKGGSLGRTALETESPALKGGVKEERLLYKPLQDYFDDEWSGAYVEPDKYFSKITGSPKGHKQKSGTWSRPDLSILTISRYEFLPMIDLELTTVEVKRYSDIGTRAIFEAASHSKYDSLVTRAFRVGSAA